MGLITKVALVAPIGARRQWAADRALRPTMRSPGQPQPSRAVLRQFWRLIATGVTTADAAAGIGYLLTSPTAAARPGCVEVPGATLSYRLPTSCTGVALTWRAKRRAPPGGVRLKEGLVMLEVALPTTVSTTGDDLPAVLESDEEAA